MLITQRCVNAAIQARKLTVTFPRNWPLLNNIPFPIWLLLPIQNPNIRQTLNSKANATHAAPEQYTHQHQSTSDTAHCRRGVTKPTQQTRRRRGLVIAASAQTASAGPPAALRHASSLGSNIVNFLSLGSFGGLVAGGVTFGVIKRGLRRWHVRRATKRRMASLDMNSVKHLTVVTFNIRGIMDRWHERAPVLHSCIEAMDADVVSFQEVLTGGGHA